MRLYLVQHAKALPKERNPERPLSEEGRGEAMRVAEFLQPSAPAVDQLWHSGKLRAAETAQIYARALGLGTSPVARNGLAPGDPVSPLRDELAARLDNTMIVGHMPFVSRLATLLLSGYESPPLVAFANAGIVCLNRTPDNAWQLLWAVTPQLLPDVRR